MSATADPVAAMFREQVTAALADVLAPLVDALAVLDQPRPGVWKPAEAAVVLGVTENTVRRWCREGVLDTLPGVDRTLIPRIAVERYLTDPGARSEPAATTRRVA